MKFYEKIIGINKDAPSDELIITFSDKGFEFDNNLYLNDGKTLSLNGEHGNVIFFRNSETVIADLDDVLHFGGSGKGISFNFYDGYIGASNWNLGSIAYPLNNIYATNGYFNNLSSSTITADTVNVKGLNIASPITLPQDSEIRVFDSTELDIAGAEIRTIIPDVDGGIKVYLNSIWYSTNYPVEWWSITTTGSWQKCVQFFIPLYLWGFLEEHVEEILIPAPFADNSTLDNYFFQLSYSDHISNTDVPTIEPFLHNGVNYLRVTQIQSKLELYIQITCFQNIS